MRDLAFVQVLAGELRAGRRLALCSVLDVRGSMPRDAGARMALLADGSLVGTVGGGAIELLCQERCRELLGGAEVATLEWLTHERTQMACGGDALVGWRLLDGADHAAIEAILALGERPAWLVEDWSDSAHPSLRVTDGRAGLEGRAGADDRPCWDEGRRRYVEPLGVPPTAYVFGAGHVGKALVPLLVSIGLRVVVLDDRPDALADGLPEDVERRMGPYGELAEEAVVTNRDVVVVLTHGHVADIDVLERVLPKGTAYVGCIGSRAKASFARDELLRRGVAPQAVEAVHLPIGERIGAETPAEIAVSIAAEVIRCRALARGSRKVGTRPC